MKEIRLIKLTLDNFKGQRHFAFAPGGGDCTVYGDNATGKSTLYDALTWLLFGKDSRGQSDFEIKPLGPDGQVLDHGAVTTVEVELSVDGEVLSLRKAYFEQWSTKRGSAQKVYGGNTSEYYSDDVPVKKSEFDRRVGELVSEGLFRTLTDVTWFCSGLGWRERRKALFEVCGVATDGEIMAGSEQFSALAAAMGRLSMDDYKKKLQAQRSGLNGARDSIPARLDELKKTEEDLSLVDFGALRAQRGEVSGKLEELKAEFLELSHGALVDSRRNALNALKNELNACINENETHLASQRVPTVDERPSLQEEVDRQKRAMLRLTGLIKNELGVIEVQEARVEECRAQWAQEDAATFQPGSCPTCGQALPPAALKEAEAKFQAEKERRKAGVVGASQIHKESAQAAKTRREQYIQEAVEVEGRIAELTERLAAYAPPETPTLVDLPGHQERVASLRERIAEAEGEVSKLSMEGGAIREAIQGKVSVLTAELGELDRSLGREGVLSYTRERMDQLRQEAAQSAQELEALDRMLFLCDEFTRYKVRFVEERINGRFGVVRWRLFTEQVNGGVADCCEATVEGVPYASLNSGARINAGLDVIAALSDCHGVRVPLFIDNAESVTRLYGAGTQVVRLVVSEADKELRCEYGT